MPNHNWLALVDYSNKYKVSISTLRRRIRGKAIQFKLEGGKYFLIDRPLNMNIQSIQNIAVNDEGRSFEVDGLDFEYSKVEANTKDEKEKKESKDNGSESVLASANKLVNEIKKSYSQILQEKEEQICQLKAQVSDLQTLARVLEEMNQPNRK